MTVHGTVGAYLQDGCRCPRCEHAHREHQWRREFRRTSNKVWTATGPTYAPKIPKRPREGCP